MFPTFSGVSLEAEAIVSHLSKENSSRLLNVVVAITLLGDPAVEDPATERAGETAAAAEAVLTNGAGGKGVEGAGLVFAA